MTVWIFNGEKGRFPSGVFAERESAEKWIKNYNLSGVLTLYPIDEGIYDWAIRNEFFKPSKVKEQTPDFIGTFSSASQEHFHYVDGQLD
jgi:hypothetical protein